jgi:glycosyltransferase involved in cell wall biosynthesis
MRKKRILFCSEATFLNTGYATYAREILNYLYQTNKYEIAELASYGADNDTRSKVPWKFFGVMPNTNDENLINSYKRNVKGQFGGFAFERVCLEFLPDIVCDIRDFWMIDFVPCSPFRKFFKWVIMPTVDAYPQAKEWINTYSSADACLSYSDWSGEVLKKQSNGKINYLGSSPPSAHPSYKPIQDKIGLKQSLGIDQNTKIIGTVMRNQRRKLYPDLFKAFRKFLDSVDNPSDYKLYCHTSYPDAGWDIPEILSDNGLYSHTLFTYVCQESNKFFVAPFNGPVCQSPFTNNLTAKLSNVKQGLSYEDLSKIINTFDLYVQYANCEGFGLPQVEAAACAVPVMSVDYSAMSSVIRQLGGSPIPVKTLYKEMETGCERAVPDNEAAAKLFKEFFDKPESIRRTDGFKCKQNFEKHFQWHQSGQVWENYFDSFEPLPIHETWQSPPNIKQAASLTKDLENKPYKFIVDWLYDNVLCEADEKHNYEYGQMIKSLMYGFHINPIIGSYFNEDDSVVSVSRKIEQSEYNIEKAYSELRSKRNKINSWEQKRAEVMGI